MEPLYRIDSNIQLAVKDYTILPTPGDPTNIILSTEDTRASPVSANLIIVFIAGKIINKAKNRTNDKGNFFLKSTQ